MYKGHTLVRLQQAYLSKLRKSLCLFVPSSSCTLLFMPEVKQHSMFADKTKNQKKQPAIANMWSVCLSRHGHNMALKLQPKTN